MYCNKCGKQLEEDWKGCPYCGNRDLNGDQEERLKREEDRKYNRKMTIWLLISCVTVIGAAVWVNSIWYQLYFFGLLDFAKNNIGGIALITILCLVLNYITKDHVLLRGLSEECAEKWMLVYEIMNWISKICYGIMSILIIKAWYELVIVNRYEFQLHFILARSQGIILWYTISEIADYIKYYICGENENDKTGIE